MPEAKGEERLDVEPVRLEVEPKEVKASEKKDDAKPVERKPVRVAFVEVYRDSAEEWRWKAKAANGKVVADSGEGYRNRPWARRMAKELYPEAKVVWGPGK